MAKSKSKKMIELLEEFIKEEARLASSICRLEKERFKLKEVIRELEGDIRENDTGSYSMKNVPRP